MRGVGWLVLLAACGSTGSDPEPSPVDARAPLGPRFVIEPNTVDFGDAVVGVDVHEITFTLSNTGDDVGLAYFNDYDVLRPQSGCAYAFSPTTICKFRVRFRANVAGPISGSWSIGQGPSAAAIHFTGIGHAVNADLVLSTEHMSFNTTPTGETDTRVLTLTNTGASATGALHVAPVMEMDGFSITSDTCGGTNLAAGESCTITFAFTPSVASAIYSDVIQIYGDVGGTSFDLFGAASSF